MRSFGILGLWPGGGGNPDSTDPMMTPRNIYVYHLLKPLQVVCMMKEFCVAQAVLHGAPLRKMLSKIVTGWTGLETVTSTLSSVINLAL